MHKIEEHLGSVYLAGMAGDNMVGEEDMVGRDNIVGMEDSLSHEDTLK